TIGTPRIERVVPVDGIPADELVRLTASLDQLSAHPLAEALAHEAVARGLSLSFPEQVSEEHGRGIVGRVDGRLVAAGSATWLRERRFEQGRAARVGDAYPGRATVAVAIDGRAAGAIVMGDHLREDAHGLAESLRRAGIRHVAMATGDRAVVGNEVGRALGLD